MHKPFGSIMVELLEDVEAGLRVRAEQTSHTGEFPRVKASTTGKVRMWIGITLVAGKAGDIVPVMPPFCGTVMVQVECSESPVRTGNWVNTEANGYFSTHEGAGEISTGVIVTPNLNEEVAPGKVVKAMAFIGRNVYDGGGYQP